MRVVEDARQLFVTLRSENRFGKSAFYQRQPTTRLVVVFVDPVADNAGYAFTRCRMTFQIRDERILAQIGANLVVAAKAEVAVRAVGQFVNSIVE